jgi:steroid Delta-isomerase
VDVVEYVRVFNAAVHDGGWSQVVAHFGDDAVLEFVGPPVGPFIGKPAIEAAYVANPPDDEIEISGSATVEGDTVTVPFRWCSSGDAGRMLFTERGGLIEHLVVVFG